MFLSVQNAIALGKHQQTYVKNLAGKQGYTAAFKQLAAQGLVMGKTTRNGSNHAFQQAHYEAVYESVDKPSGESAATRSLEGESAVIPAAKYVATTVSLLQSPHSADLVIGIAAATGRRTIEVLQIGKFSEEKAKPDSYLS